MMENKEEKYREILSPEQYSVLREKATERAFSGQYYNHFEPGCYRCAACGNLLFASEKKFASPCGWPSFNEAVPGSVRFIPDNSHGMVRTEVVCSACGSHLGHVFPDMMSQSGQRYCINSLALSFSNACRRSL